jgi:ABC-2 type transport system permease protein
VTNVFSAAWVIARRDFVATVWSRSYIIFLLAPLLIFGFSALVGLTAGRAERDASRPTVAVITDTATADALDRARARLVPGTSERIFPELRRIAPAENVEAQAQRLLADQEQRLSAVLTGTIERPVVIGPPTFDEEYGARIALLVEEARRSQALDGSGASVQGAAPQRVATDNSAGTLRSMRRGLAQGAQFMIFMVTLMLATLLLSNLVEEKSNKVIEILAAAVPLDAIFLGKLLAMLGASLVGLAIWGGMLGIAYAFFQTMQSWMAVPEVTPAVGWPVFVILLLLYYAANYMLLGALFLGIGGQASNIREIQSLSMPVTFLQLGVLVLGMMAVGGDTSDGWTLAAFAVPFSSPLAMAAFAAESPTLWPHLLALVWQALWVVIIIRLAASLFRRTVLKSSGRRGFWEELKGWGRA